MNKTQDSKEYELRIKTPNILKFVRKLSDNYRETVEVKAIAQVNEDGTKTII